MNPKKSLGQNFFVNEKLADRIVEIVSKENPDLVIEIGPGKGFFTEKLQDSGNKVSAIEKDDELTQFLREQNPNLEVLNIDFLDLDLDSLNIPEKTIFFGSLPYNVSKPIIRKILNSNIFKYPAFFIIQKEVADKYIAKEPQNNILSIQAQLNSIPKKLFDISKGSFRPVPKVTSSFIQFTPKNEYLELDIEKFSKFITTCFSSPRKTLKNNLRSLLRKEDLSLEILQKRPQELSLEEFKNLFTFLK